jgi:galactokinase
MLAEHLTGKGLSPTAARQKAELFVKAAAPLLSAGGSLPAPLAFFVPGRIEVLGKHTDYAGGRSMVAAVEQGFCTVVWPGKGRHVTVTDVARAESVEFDLEPTLSARSGHWSNYPMTVARRIARNFPQARRGADVFLASDLPSAAGMSSSSAMIVAMFLALAEVNYLWADADRERLASDRLHLAEYLGCVENGQSFGSLVGDRGVGTFGGSEDHTAILCGLANHVSQYAYCPVEFELAIPLPPGYTFAIGVSGVVAEKTGAALEKYNTASRLASVLAELWRRETGRVDPHVAGALNSSPDAPAHFRQIAANPATTQFSAAALTARLEHFMAESGEIIPAASRALQRADLAAFGRQVDRSQQLAETLLGNQVPETIFLAASARRHGAAAASAFGAGFGGSVWALVSAAEAQQFLTAWAETYREKFPQHVQSFAFFTTAAGPAAFRVCQGSAEE